jgi:hypothetical protein
MMNMKKIYLTFGILLTGLLAPVSCSYLDKMPDDQLTMEMIFNDNVRIEDWLAGIYSSVPDPYTGFMRSIGYDVLSGELTPNSGWKPWDWEIINMRDGGWSPTTKWPVNYWVELPKRIREGYIFLEKAAPIPPKLSSTVVERMKAEVRFLIAYYYWLLLEAYGPIPFNPGPDFVYSDFNDLDAMSFPQKPFNDIVRWIDNELLELAQSGILPAVYTNVSEFGHATSIACLAVRARMLLFAASPLVNGNPDYATHVNSEGVLLFNDTYDPGKWTYAAQACRQLIDAAESAGHALYIEKNRDGTIDPFLSYQNMMFKKWNEGNHEILFARPQYDESISVFDYERDASPHGLGPFGGGLGVTQELVDDFFMKDGRPTGKGFNDQLIDRQGKSPAYTETGFTADVERRNTQWTYVQQSPTGNETGIVTLNKTYKMYADREPRFYISVLFNGGWIKMAPNGLRRANFLLNTKDDWGNASDNIGTHDAPENGYLVRKKVHPDMSAHDAGSNHPYRPLILYRLAEAYLSYAEALHESEPGHPDILLYLNKVRERAGIAPYGPYEGQTGLLAPDDIREAIRRERRIELNCEGIHFTDLRRWKLGEERLNRHFHGMNAKGTEYKDDPNGTNSKAFFKRTPYLAAPRIFTKKHYWFPVPQEALEKNPKLVQNPYWNE